MSNASICSAIFDDYFDVALPDVSVPSSYQDALEMPFKKLDDISILQELDLSSLDESFFRDAERSSERDENCKTRKKTEEKKIVSKPVKNDPKKEERLKRNRASAKRSRESKVAAHRALIQEIQRIKEENQFLKNQLNYINHMMGYGPPPWSVKMPLPPSVPRKSYPCVVQQNGT
jgi:actin-related protein